jgi:hypothetical protein
VEVELLAALVLLQLLARQAMVVALVEAVVRQGMLVLQIQVVVAALVLIVEALGATAVKAAQASSSSPTLAHNNSVAVSSQLAVQTQFIHSRLLELFPHCLH